MVEKASNCQVVDNARARAQARGFDPRLVSCPLLTANACDGSSCIFAPLREVVAYSSQADKFFKRIEAKINNDNRASN